MTENLLKIILVRYWFKFQNFYFEKKYTFYILIETLGKYPGKNYYQIFYFLKSALSRERNHPLWNFLEENFISVNQIIFRMVEQYQKVNGNQGLSTVVRDLNK